MALALEGIKVVETASLIAGPMAGRLLANWEADVIHIEHPARSETIFRLRQFMQHRAVVL